MAFLKLFFFCFRGRALPERELASTMRGFARLPEAALVQAGRLVEFPPDLHPFEWLYWLDGRPIVEALGTAEWLYGKEEKQTVWAYPSPVGLGMLGLGPLPPAPPLATDLKALPNLAIFAGAGLDAERLLPLFRFCKIQRIDQMFEFQIDRRRLETTPSKTSAAKELRAVLKGLEPLPSTLEDALATRSRLGGKVAIRACRALVKPESAEVLAALRDHPQLKGFLEAGAPPGYLLIKARSDPANFVRRCQNLGFQVQAL